MLLDYIKESLIKKWNEYDGHPEYLLPDVSFNKIFPPIDWDYYHQLETEIGISFPQELKNFYSECNGCRLFLSSFSIFGLQNGSRILEPYDLVIENHNIHERMKENGCDDQNYFFFGNYGRNYVFAFKIDESNRLYMLENGKATVITRFDSLESLIHYFMPRMLDHYDDKYECDQPKTKYKNIPVLKNALYDLSSVGL